MVTKATCRRDARLSPVDLRPSGAGPNRVLSRVARGPGAPLVKWARPTVPTECGSVLSNARVGTDSFIPARPPRPSHRSASLFPCSPYAVQQPIIVANRVGVRPLMRLCVPRLTDFFRAPCDSHPATPLSSAARTHLPGVWVIPVIALPGFPLQSNMNFTMSHRSISEISRPPLSVFLPRTLLGQVLFTQPLSLIPPHPYTQSLMRFSLLPMARDQGSLRTRALQCPYIFSHSCSFPGQPVLPFAQLVPSFPK